MHETRKSKSKSRYVSVIVGTVIAMTELSMMLQEMMFVCTAVFLNQVPHFHFYSINLCSDLNVLPNETKFDTPTVYLRLIK